MDFGGLPEWLDPEIWDDFCEHRNEKGKPLSDRSLRRLLKRLDRYRKAGHNPNDMLEHTISMGWLDVFPAKEAPEPRRPRSVDVTGLAEADDREAFLAEREREARRLH